MLVGTLYGAYELISDLTAGARGPALAHALSEVRLERDLGWFQEQAIQHWALGARWLVEAANVFYVTVHFVMPVVTLAYLLWRAPERYRRWRDVLAWLTGLSLICFALDPVLPPRLLPSAYGFVDTAQVMGGAGRLDTILLSDVGNLYAAMPSLHVAWAAWCAAALVPVVRRRWVKALLVADPIVTTFVVVVTANHFFLDVAGGLAVLGAGAGLARWRWRWPGRRRPPGRSRGAVSAEPY